MEENFCTSVTRLKTEIWLIINQISQLLGNQKQPFLLMCCLQEATHYRPFSFFYNHKVLKKTVSESLNAMTIKLI